MTKPASRGTLWAAVVICGSLGFLAPTFLMPADISWWEHGLATSPAGFVFGLAGSHLIQSYRQARG